MAIYSPWISLRAQISRNVTVVFEVLKSINERFIKYYIPMKKKLIISLKHNYLRRQMKADGAINKVYLRNLVFLTLTALKRSMLHSKLNEKINNSTRILRRYVQIRKSLIFYSNVLYKEFTRKLHPTESGILHDRFKLVTENRQQNLIQQ